MMRKTNRRGRRSQEAEPVSGPNFDGGVVSAVLLLAGLGVVMVYSTTAAQALDRLLPPHFLRQASALGVGFVIALGAARLPLRVWQRLAWPFWGVSVALLAGVLVAGVEVNGARRWLGFPGLGAVFQPAELAKFSCVLIVASILAGKKGRAEVSAGQLVAALLLGVVPAGLLVVQPDLGNAVLCVGLVGLLLVVAGAPLRILIAPAAIGAIAVGGYIATHAYALARVKGFLDPWATAHQQGYQLVQSFVAFGRGGLFGVGWGASLQKLHYLPEAHTDFILAVIAEELGLVGVLVVFGAFAVLLVTGLRIALRAEQRFDLLVALGMTVLLVVPAVINGAVVMGLLPTKGLTLPFLSYGRSSLLVSCLAVGVILGIGRREARPRQKAFATADPRGLIA